MNSDVAYVGSVGLGLDSEMTAMGDAVNVTARLSSLAAAGEILIPVDAAGKAGVVAHGLEHRSLDLKGKQRADRGRRGTRPSGGRRREVGDVS